MVVHDHHLTVCDMKLYCTYTTVSALKGKRGNAVFAKLNFNFKSE